MHSSSAAD